MVGVGLAGESLAGEGLAGRGQVVGGLAGGSLADRWMSGMRRSTWRIPVSVAKVAWPEGPVSFSLRMPRMFGGRWKAGLGRLAGCWQ